MKLLIVESPGKIKKLQAILGSQWLVAASFGHIRDLPVKTIGVEAPSFVPQYQPTDKGKDVIKRLQELVKKVDEVYLATDPDREGEAIAWHLEDALNLKNPKRVSYTSITEKEVLESINNARSIDMNLVKAQEARRVLDRLCGYMVSPIISNAFAEKLSAGRVQSPAVSIISAREKAIRSFVSTTHYGVEAIFEAVENIQDGWKAIWKTENFLEENQEYILDKKLAENIAKLKTFSITDFSETEAKQAPPAPFTTSSLQQASSNALKFSPKKTMEVAQKLYEAGHITYMRTDSPNLSDEAIQEIRAYCTQNALDFVESPRTWKTKGNAQEAHEAIRPTHIEAEEIEGSADEKVLYELIRLRVLACQLKEAVFSVRKMTLEADFEGKKAIFEAQGRTLIEKGWKNLFENDSALADEEEDSQEMNNPIPQLKADNLLSSVSSEVKTKKTKPPTRYTQASLVRELEKQGIGRPATYASILDNILQRGYITEEKRKLHATALGEKLIDGMTGNFSFLDLKFTKNMEDGLDDIGEGKMQYIDIIKENHSKLQEEVEVFQKANAIPCPSCNSYNFKHLKGKSKEGKAYDFFKCEACEEVFSNEGGMPVKKEKKEIPLTDFDCEKCGHKLKHIQGSKNGNSYDFFSCSNAKCNTNYDNVDGTPTKQAAKENTGNKTKFKCKKCKKALLEKPTKNGGIWFACSGYPDCKERYWANEDNTPKFEA